MEHYQSRGDSRRVDADMTQDPLESWRGRSSPGLINTRVNFQTSSVGHHTRLAAEGWPPASRPGLTLGNGCDNAGVKVRSQCISDRSHCLNVCIGNGSSQQTCEGLLCFCVRRCSGSRSRMLVGGHVATKGSPTHSPSPDSAR